MLKSTLLAASPVHKVEETTLLQSLTYIPDDNFESALIQFGYDDELDNYVETDKISQVQSLKLNDREDKKINIESINKIIPKKINSIFFFNVNCEIYSFSYMIFFKVI